MSNFDYCYCPQPEYKYGKCAICKKWLDNPKDFKKRFEKLGRGKCQCEESMPDYTGVCQKCAKKVTFEQPVAEVEENEVDIEFENRPEIEVFSWSNLNPRFIIGSQTEVVLDSVYLGGAGIPLKTYQKTSINVSENGFLIGQPYESMWANSYEGLIGIQISGEGLYQTGGGWIGGGLGVGGALKGAAFASVMNALTTRTHNDCYFRFIYSGVEGNFQILSHTPRDLEIALSGVRNWLETRSVEIPKERKGNSLASSADELEKLWELHKKGILTEEEFQKAKRKLLD